MLCCSLLLVPVAVLMTYVVARSLPPPDATAGVRSPFCDEPDPELRRAAELVYWCATAVLTVGVASLPEFWTALDRTRRYWKAADSTPAAAQQGRRRKRELTSHQRTAPRGLVPS
ncbi:uncharacterized protein LOC126427950 [Schistocerca serialis cubense]|uniref:uncharacterized protein LOC126427950 n=1 Tax=Schistocerca serialis cubense TaxID=2023355 RepID=UPI00214F54CC|nr:uncharacterized protein LOC126427950 [Schistocerca serialis cubense]